MKGTILVCLREVIIKAGGEGVWSACLKEAGFEPFTIFTPSADVPDSQTVAMVGAACKLLNISLQEAADAFGDHWVNVYSPKLYRSLYAKHTTARAFFADINEMHDRLTRQLPNARPPRFKLNWTSENTLVMHYDSPRGLVEIAIGMARAVGRFYSEEVKVTRLSDTDFRVVFGAEITHSKRPTSRA